tara:strand:+ start:14928 stop:15728 length:801 start_codon:yes stop_codon:yes gene_type:complete
MTKTISFNMLGRYGRLGNSMFQYAAVLGSARASGHNPICHLSGIPLMSECFELGSVQDGQIEPDLLLNEQGFNYQQIAHNIPFNRSVDFRGYFQTEKYFKHVETEVRQNFAFKQYIKDLAIEKIPEDVCVSVHVRRGDYVALAEYHHNQTMEYYHEALSKFPRHRPVFFSDDIAWCKENFSHIDKAVFVENEETLNTNATYNSDISGYVDMCAMSFCNDHIIANSSFSWWGAWLGQGNVVAPKKWFGSKKENENHEDIYCEGWMVV